jgi:hypothetical protein
MNDVQNLTSPIRGKDMDDMLKVSANRVPENAGNPSPHVVI